jgi:hypothetical protein
MPKYVAFSDVFEGAAAKTVEGAVLRTNIIASFERNTDKPGRDGEKTIVVYDMPIKAIVTQQKNGNYVIKIDDGASSENLRRAFVRERNVQKQLKQSEVPPARINASTADLAGKAQPSEGPSSDIAGHSF